MPRRRRPLGIWESSRSRGCIGARRLVLVSKPRGRRKRIGRRGRPLRTGSDTKYAKTAHEPWLLTTSLWWPPKTVVAVYGRRMQIEELFRDAKNHRFGWSLGGVVAHTAACLDVLLLVAALGIIASDLLGMAAETSGLHLRFQANAVRDRRALSFFVLGTLVAASGAYDLLPRDLAAALDAIRKKVIALAS